ncbi:MAG: DUF1080 domain-containing protein [Pirellulales bacterium]|nr:DUF1080 domain-containing protein [Pirellulales bacterium]
MSRFSLLFYCQICVCALLVWGTQPCPAPGQPTKAKLNQPPPGFVQLFNGENLDGWKGLVGDPRSRAKMSADELESAQQAADERMRAHWKVEDGVLVFDGQGDSLCTAKDYGDFEMLVDWKIKDNGDSGIYLRGSPQVQIWDPAQHPEGSGGLYNNQKHPRKPTTKADKPVGEWNRFRIKMHGSQVWVWLNGRLVTDGVVMENYWDRSKPMYPTGQIELQNHGNTLYFRNIFIKEIVTTEDAQKIAAGIPAKAIAKPKSPRKVLIYTHAAGFVHSSIPHGARAVQMMGEKTGVFEGTISEDPAVFSAESLKQYDGIVLVNTTGDWLRPRREHFRRLSDKEKAAWEKREAENKQALLNFVRNGKGLVGIHAASDCHYEWKDFGKMIGGYFDSHPWHEEVGMTVEEPDHALCRNFANEKFTITDEIYQFKSPYNRNRLRVLLSMNDEITNLDRGNRNDDDYAVSWVRKEGKGRVFYGSLGHREEIFWNSQVMRYYLNGIQYALGDLEAKDAPRQPDR